jgi:type I restriction enzyme S subunit
MTQERRLVGHAARIPRLPTGFGIMSMDLVRVTPSGDLPRHFLHGLLRFSNFSAIVSQHANGVNVLHLNPRLIEAYEFASPPLELARRFAEVSESLYNLSDVLQAKNLSLRQTRDLLLPRLISGELEVSELDIKVGEDLG